MRKIVISLLILTLMRVFPAVVMAQDDAVFTSGELGVSIPLLDGWTSMPYNEGTYLFGLEEDVRRVESGEQPENIVIHLRLIETHPADDSLGDNLSDLATTRRPEVGSLDGLETVYPETALNGWMYTIVAVEDRFVVTGMWPEDQTEAAEEILIDFISRIEVNSARYTIPLTRWMSVGNMRFRAPEMWLLATDATPNFYIVTTQRERISAASMFRVTRLSLEIRDLSAFRPMLSGESLLDLSGFWINDEVISSGAVTLRETDVNGIEAHMISFSDESLQGEAYLLLTPTQAYFFAGSASPDSWRDGDRELFEAIIATIEIDAG